MKKYEAMCVLLAESEAEQSGINFVREKLKEHGAVIEKEESMGTRTLAYPIRDNTQGSYFYFVANMDPHEAQKIPKELQLRTELLRFLLVKR